MILFARCRIFLLFLWSRIIIPVFFFERLFVLPFQHRRRCLVLHMLTTNSRQYTIQRIFCIFTLTPFVSLMLLCALAFTTKNTAKNTWRKKGLVRMWIGSHEIRQKKKLKSKRNFNKVKKMKKLKLTFCQLMCNV